MWISLVAIGCADPVLRLTLIPKSRDPLKFTWFNNSEQKVIVVALVKVNRVKNMFCVLFARDVSTSYQYRGREIYQ